MQYKKAVTFSFDDGSASDKQLIELLNKYNLKCSFNINGGKIEDTEVWQYKDFTVKKLIPCDAELYKGHEICLHGYNHRPATDLDKTELYYEFSEDKKCLEQLFETGIEGAAYAYGLYNDDVVAQLQTLDIKFARTARSNGKFDLQDDLMRFEPTCHFADDKTPELIHKFLNLTSDKPQLLYIWGHSYEIDGDNSWTLMNEICERLSGHKDIFYGTNSEVFRYFNII